jgi:8-oxo-dGTP pyrophosphatase MutT (NUDIX family)
VRPLRSGKPAFRLRASVNALFEQLEARLKAQPGRALNLPGVELREAAVLAPLFVRGGVPHALFTKRPKTLRNHGGQISFPGGGKDAEDLTLLHTALRETEEELGIPSDRVRVLGMLDEIPTITQFRVVPFVGVIPGDLAYRPNPEEIEEIIEVPIPHLLDPSIHRVENWRVSDEEHEVYFYDFGPHVIWGATARIVKNLLAHWRELTSIARSQ